MNVAVLGRYKACWFEESWGGLGKVRSRVFLGSIEAVALSGSKPWAVLTTRALHVEMWKPTAPSWQPTVATSTLEPPRTVPGTGCRDVWTAKILDIGGEIMKLRRNSRFTFPALIHDETSIFSWSIGQSTNFNCCFFGIPIAMAPWLHWLNEDLPGVRELFETEIVPDAPRKTRRRSRRSYMNLLGGFKHCVLFFFPWCLPMGIIGLKKMNVFFTQKHDKTWACPANWGIPPSSYLKMWKG